MIMGRHDCRWSLLVQVTCMTSLAWLVASGAPRNAVSDTEERVLNTSSDSEVGGARENSRNPSALALLSTSRPTPPVESPWPAGGRNSTELHEGPPTSQRDVVDGGQTRRWHFTHISARFLTGKTFRVRATAVSRAVVGAVFIAISLIIAVAMFTCIWCCCRCDKGRGHDEQIGPPAASYASYPQPLTGLDKVPYLGSYPASTPQCTDLPPPYDLPALHVFVSPEAVPGEPRPTAVVREDEQPPAYHAAVSSIFPARLEASTAAS